MHAQNNYKDALKTDKARIKYLNHLVNDLCGPNTKFIFNQNDPKDFKHYTEGTSVDVVLEDFATIIHEFYHTINSRNSTRKILSYNLAPEKTIQVNYTECFKSEELNKVVRKGMQDSIFRYGLYIGNVKELHGGVELPEEFEEGSYSNAFGIYGILEEFIAYKNGFYASMELLDEFESFAKKDTSIIESYFDEVNGNTMAFYEFRWFCAKYLEHAKNNFPEQYKELYQNKELRVVMSIVMSEYQEGISRFEKIFQKNKFRLSENLAHHLRFDHSEADYIAVLEYSDLDTFVIEEKVMVDGVVQIKKTINAPEELMVQIKDYYNNITSQIKEASKGYPLMVFHSNTNAEVKYLKEIYTTDLQQIMNHFLFKNCTSSNYEQFLK